MASEPRRVTMDSREFEWDECQCGGRVGIRGRMVVHDHPACEGFSKALAAAGAELVWAKDVSLS